MAKPVYPCPCQSSRGHETVTTAQTRVGRGGFEPVQWLRPHRPRLRSHRDSAAGRTLPRPRKGEARDWTRTPRGRDRQGRGVPSPTSSPSQSRTGCRPRAAWGARCRAAAASSPEGRQPRAGRTEGSRVGPTIVKVSAPNTPKQSEAPAPPSFQARRRPLLSRPPYLGPHLPPYCGFYWPKE